MAFLKRKLRNWLSKRGYADQMRRQKLLADVALRTQELRAAWAKGGAADASVIEMMQSCQSYTDIAEHYLMHERVEEARSAMVNGAAAMVNAAEEMDKLLDAMGDAAESVREMNDRTG